MTVPFIPFQTPIAIPSSGSRKRKDVDEDGDCDYDEQAAREAPSSKGSRVWGRLLDGDEEARFHPLPRELNLQLLANLGYNVNSNEHEQYTPGQFSAARLGKSNHSPSSSSSTSSFFPPTPNDAAFHAESYFVKGMQEDCASYPDFKIYPEQPVGRSPGLMGVRMQHSSSSQSNLVSPDGMDVDGGEQQQQAGPSHGDHCKSIPQLHCRGNGATKELWARCPDCGSMSPVDCAPVVDALSYSP